jgi:hypothetical protein
VVGVDVGSKLAVIVPPLFIVALVFDDDELPVKSEEGELLHPSN